MSSEQSHHQAYFRLKNEVAIVTGAASGIGRGIALRFAKEGASVALVDTNEEGAKHVADEIRKQGGEALALQTDIRNPEEVAKTIEAVIAAWKRVTILVNNAGIERATPLLTPDISQAWKEVAETNFHGTFHMTEGVVKTMVQYGWKGTIITMTSVQSEIPVSKGACYPATKAALKAATKSWALELAPYGIRVNAIAPGAIRNTGLNHDVNTENDVQKAKEWNIPLERCGTPEDIADAAVFLATNSYMTGQEIVVDGGLSLTH